MTIGDQFIFRLKPNLNFLTKCRPFIKSEAFLIDHVKRVAREMFQKGEILSLSSFKEEMTDEIDLFWQNRVLNAQILIQEKSADLIRGESFVFFFLPVCIRWSNNHDIWLFADRLQYIRVCQAP